MNRTPISNDHEVRMETDKVYAWIERHYGIEITHSGIGDDLRELINGMVYEAVKNYKQSCQKDK